MIDDWVFSCIASKYVQVIELFENYAKCTKHRCIASRDNEVIGDYKSLSPIELTSEILEKNGFSRENSCTGSMFAYSEYRDNKGDFDLYICNGVRKGSTCGEINEFQFTAIRYVHELQHALKLCKIDKQIRL